MESGESMKEALLDKRKEGEEEGIQEIPRDELPDSTLYRKFKDVDEVRVQRFCATPETRRFIYINPAIYSQFSGLGLFAFLDQFLKLWPTIRIAALPYISIPAVTAGSVGFGIGVHSVYHSNDEHTNRFKRIWFSALEGGGIVFPFLLGEEIEVYCSYPSHLDAEKNCMVSEATFWETFFPAPAVLGLGYMIWKMIPLLQKHTWMSRGKASKFLVIAVDSLADVLYYSRIFQTLMTNISQIPQPLAYELGAIPAGGIVLVGQTLMPRHREKFRTAITFGMTLNLMLYLGNFLKIEFTLPPETEEGPYLWSPLLKTIAFALFFGVGAAFTIWRSRQYVVEQRKTERWIPAGDPKFLLQQQLNEALERPEVRRDLIKRLLQDQQLKQLLVQDEFIKNLLLQDQDVQGSLQIEVMDKLGFTDVSLDEGSDASEDERQGDQKKHRERESGVLGKSTEENTPEGVPILYKYNQTGSATSSVGSTALGSKENQSPPPPKRRSSCTML